VIFLQEITIITKNEVGVLSKICGLLGNYGVNIETISAQGLGESGLIRIVTKDASTAKKILEREGYSIKSGEIVVVRIKDAPGELYKVTKKISQAKIDIESLYLLSKEKGGNVEIAIKTNDIDQTKKILKI